MRHSIRQVVFIFIVLLPALQIRAQNKSFATPLREAIVDKKQGGTISLGIRNTFSFFNDGDPKGIGTGGGGHMRLQISNRINTEWYADVFTSNIHNKAHRADFHIGVSVMYYLIDPKGFSRKFTPYVVGGYCFDETIIKINGEGGASGNRFSSMVQTGIGCSYNVTPRFDISLTTQYGFHLGKEIDLEEHPDGSMSIETEKNAGWQGHLMVSISVNYKIFKLWNRKKQTA